MSAKRSNKFPPNIGETYSNAEPGSKSANFDDPYEHPPPELNGDPWATLLAPELEADKIRCDAWKEEVQNLLIFAGLFSAVVTAFVIESYKSLQPDPNTAVIGLLFYIANNLNGSSLSHNTATSPLSFDPGSLTAPFSQTSSSVRVNVLWFLSLIISLTTVLVGTIALQWLREHQSYSGYSSKEALAILHMRSEAIKAWHVPRFFAALPLLLQSALVLFFIGMIDFALPLGPNFSIPVSVVIGLTLLFLATTTALPTFQKIFILAGPSTGRHNKTIPTPCAYKSPQSHALHTLTEFILRFVSLALPRIYYHPESQNHEFDNASELPPHRRHLFPHINTIWHQKTWCAWDREWLSLRDACHQGILDTDQGLYIHRTDWKDSLPLSDITQYLVKAVKEVPSSKHTESFLTAVYYCFKEVSESLWPNPSRVGHFPWESIDRRNHYLEQLQQFERHICSTFNFLTHGGVYKFGRFSVGAGEIDNYKLVRFIKQHYVLFHHDQMLMFLNILLERQTSKILASYRKELGLRILYYLLNSSYLRVLVPTAGDFFSATVFHTFRHPTWINEASDVSDDCTEDLDIVDEIFRSVAVANIPQGEFTRSLYIDCQMCHLVSRLAAKIASTPKFRPSVLTYISDRLTSSFSFVADHLNNEISPSTALSNSTRLGGNTSTVLYYLSSVFLHGICRESPIFIARYQRDMDSNFGQCLDRLLDTLRRYRERKSGKNNDVIEERFQGLDTYIRDSTEVCLKRFSDEWWNFLFKFSQSTSRGFPLEHDYTDVGLVLPVGSLPLNLPSSDTLPRPITGACEGALRGVTTRSLEQSRDSNADFGAADGDMVPVGIHEDKSFETLVGTCR